MRGEARIGDDRAADEARRPPKAVADAAAACRLRVAAELDHAARDGFLGQPQAAHAMPRLGDGPRLARRYLSAGRSS